MEIRRCGALPLRRPGASSNLQPQIRVNGRIRAREIRVIMGSTGEQLGVMKLSDALRKAQGLGLDLVEIAPTATPPVCKIIDFGKFRYDISKQTKDKRPSGIEAEGNQVSSQHRRARLSDENPARRRVPGSGK